MACYIQWRNFQGLVSLAPLGEKLAHKMAPLNCLRTWLQRSTLDARMSFNNLSRWPRYQLKHAIWLVPHFRTIWRPLFRSPGPPGLLAGVTVPTLHHWLYSLVSIFFYKLKQRLWWSIHVKQPSVTIFTPQNFGRCPPLALLYNLSRWLIISHQRIALSLTLNQIELNWIEL